MDVQPMLAQDAPALPEGPGWRYEPKYDGLRLLAIVNSGRARLLSRNGNDKTGNFPEVAAALEELYRKVGQNFLLDGELVSAASACYAGFQALQSRINLRARHRRRILAELQPAALIVFDALVIGSTPLVNRPLHERRRELVRLLRGRTGSQLRIALQGRSGSRVLGYVIRRGLEGVVAKQETSPYLPGQRLAHWLKYKLTLRQEFVVVGYTESEARESFRALLLAYHDGGTLRYAGSVGAGFSREMLSDCRRRLDELDPTFCPFGEIPRGRGAIRWVRPALVVEVKFEAWTKEGKVRNPRFMALRTDKDPRDVVRERGPS